MTDKPELSWHPTTIEELQRLLDSGVWPRVRAIADDVGPLQVVQGRLTCIGADGMSEILRENMPFHGADTIDFNQRSLWLWRAEVTEPKHDKPPRFDPELSRLIEKQLTKLERRIDDVRSWPEHERWLDIAGPIRSWCAEVRSSGTLDLPLVVAVCSPGPTSEEIKEPEFDMPPSVAGVDFCVVEVDGGGWRMEASCDDPEGPLGPECIVRGEDRDSKAEAVVDAWEYAFVLRTGQMDRAIHISRAAASRVQLNLNDRAHFVLTDFGAAQWAEWEKGTTERFAGLFERSECTVSVSSSSAAAGQYSCKLWELAQALGSSMYIGAQRVIEDNAIEVEVQPSDVEKASPGKMERKCDAEAEVERLADYLLRHHASECTGPGSGVSAVDVAIRLLDIKAFDRSERAATALAVKALDRIALASGFTSPNFKGCWGDLAIAVAERVEKQLALRGPVLRTDDEQIDRAALDRLTAYMRINHAHSLNSGHVADVATCDDPEGPLGPECIVRGEDRDSKAEAVVDAWEYAFVLRTSQRKNPSDAESEVERLADYLLRHHAGACTEPGVNNSVDVTIRLLERAGEDRRRLTAVLAGRDEQQQLMGEVEDGLRKIARASGMIVDVYQPAHVYVSALVERVEKQLALRSPVLRTDDEQIDRAALDRLTTYMRINHAHSLNSGHVADVATWALAKYAKDHGLLCEQLGLLPVTSSSGVRAAIKGMAKDIDDARERLAKWCPECDPGKTSLRGVIVLLEADVLKPSAEARERVAGDLARCDEALRRIAAASGLMAIAMRAPEFAMGLAERVEKQLALRIELHGAQAPGPLDGVSVASEMQRIARAVGLNWYADDVFTILQASHTIAERVELRLQQYAEAFDRIGSASGLNMRLGVSASELAERVEQQFADFRKVADQLSIDREIAGAAEQLVRRLVDRLVETDPEYIEQLRRSGS